MKIDVFKHFKLPQPVVCGLVMEIISPKGIRTMNEATGVYHYNLHTDLQQIYEGDPAQLQDGLYWIVDIARIKGEGLQWNHFLLEINDGEADILESYYNIKSSDWIPKALPTIKQHFLLDTE